MIHRVALDGTKQHNGTARIALQDTKAIRVWLRLPWLYWDILAPKDGRPESNLLVVFTIDTGADVWCCKEICLRECFQDGVGAEVVVRVVVRDEDCC